MIVKIVSNIVINLTLYGPCAHNNARCHVGIITYHNLHTQSHPTRVIPTYYIYREREYMHKYTINMHKKSF
jgi:hypothetical protein